MTLLKLNTMRKKYIKITFIALVAGIAAILIVACNKSNDDVISASGIVQQFTPAKEAVPDLLSMFTQNHQDHLAGIKSGGESMDLGEAIWTLEGGVNYEYRGDKSELRYTAMDTLLLTANIFTDENQIYQIYSEDVYDIYDEMLRFAATLVDEENILLFASLDVVSTQPTYVELKYTVVLGFGGINQSGMNETDYWYAANGLGKCGSYAGTQIGKDATDRIRFFLNAEQVNVSYWTDVDIFIGINLGFVTCPDNNECFWGPDPADTCLDPEEMAYWLDKAFYVVGYFQPSGKQRIKAYFTWDLITSDNPPICVHYFEYISYGIPHVDPPAD
jgi:hypothetical protein